MIALFVWACGEPEDADTASAGLSYEAFRSEYVGGFCGWYLDCYADNAALNDIHAPEDCEASSSVREVNRWPGACYDYDEVAAGDCLAGLPTACDGGYVAVDACDSVCDE